MISSLARGIFIALDKLANVLLLGSPHHTLSMRLGFACYCMYVRPRYSWVVKLQRAVDWFFWNRFWKLEENHCFNAYEAEEARSKPLWMWYEVIDEDSMAVLIYEIEQLTFRGRSGGQKR